MQNNPELPAVAAQLSSQAREHVQTHKKRQDAPRHERDSNDQDARADGEAAAAKRQRRSPGGNEWLRAWAWKREHRPDKQVAGELPKLLAATICCPMPTRPACTLAALSLS